MSSERKGFIFVLKCIWDPLSRNKLIIIFLVSYISMLLYLYRKVSFELLGYGDRQYFVKRSKKILQLSKEELAFTADLVDPEDLTESFDNIKGLKSVKEGLEDQVVYPLQHPQIYGDRGITGILLYGSPGTGKTMLARAIAKRINASFLQVKTETLFSKYVGESEKLAAAVFTLAEKIGDCVIFFDEIDAFLTSRRGILDQPVYTHCKTIFMSHWDGLMNNHSRVIVIGTTNRRDDLDEAIIAHRMPYQYKVPLPDVDVRKELFQMYTGKELNLPVSDVRAMYYPLMTHLAERSEGYSGSDIKALCHNAKSISLRPLIQSLEKSTIPHDDISVTELLRNKRFTIHDFEKASKPMRIPLRPSHVGASLKDFLD